jgi:hypothetical protein
VRIKALTYAGSDEFFMRLEAEERRYAELRATHVVHYYDGGSIMLGPKVAPTMDETRMDGDRGL